MRQIRVRTENATRMVNAIIRHGGVARSEAGATGQWNGGCTDENCCIQHPADWDRPGEEVWSTIHTNISGNAAHRIWVAEGIVE